MCSSFVRRGVKKVGGFSELCRESGDHGYGMRSSGLSDESRRTLQPIQSYPAQWPPGGQGNPLQCKKHPSGLKGKAGLKYVQPPVPQSFKPEKRYRPPDYKMDNETIYKLSYPGVDAETVELSRTARMKGHPDNLHASSQPLSQDTTFRLSYTGIQGERAQSYKPIMRYNMMGKGPLQSVTTQRHDYTPKYVFDRPTTILAPNNIQLSTAKMEDNTTTRLSYQPVEGERVQSYKPVGVYRKPEFKIEQDTINRLSYQPWDPIPKEDYPWRKPPEYQQPRYSMENNTIYRASFLPNLSIERAASYKPLAGFKPSDMKMAQETIYKESYQNAFDVYSPVEPTVRPGNIYTSGEPMSQDTTFRLSYQGSCGDRAVPYKPINRNMMSTEPLQSITTQRHDFTPKPIIPTESFKPKTAFMSSEHKMDDTTTFRASYLPNDPMPRAESYKPISTYRKPSHALASDTINRLSYQPWQALPKEEYPWLKRPEYRQPNYSMEGTSIYRGSYIAPGNYVPDENSPPGIDEPCTCMNEGQGRANDDL